MAEFQCPHCGATLQVVVHTGLQPIAAGGGQWTQLRPLATSASIPPGMRDAVQSTPSFTEAHRTSPARAANVDADVRVPMFQTLLTGAFVGIPVGIGGAILIDGAWWLCIVVPVCTTGVAWILFMLDIHLFQLRIVEKIFNKDFDGDGMIGDQPVSPRRIRVEVDRSDEERQSFSFADLPCPDLPHLQAFASEVLDEESPTTFSGRGAMEWGFTREGDWVGLRDIFIAHGWARWRDPNSEKQGVELTAAGKGILRAIARYEV